MLFAINISEEQAFAIACQESKHRQWSVPLRDECEIQLRYKMCQLHWCIEGKTMPESSEYKGWPFTIAVDVEQGTIAYACSKNRSRKSSHNL